MLNIIDIVIIFILILGAIVGFKRGVIKSATMFIGAIIVIILAFYLKNPVSKLLYQTCPFFELYEPFTGLTSLNIIIYEAIAFVAVYMILLAILQVIIKISGILEKILKFTIILGIPSKILGAVFGLLEHFIFVFIAVFAIMQIPTTSEYILESKIANTIAHASPVLSNVTEKYYNAVKDVISLKDTQGKDKEEYNRDCLNILLKYDIVDASTAKELVESGKLTIKDADSLFKEYER